MSNVGTPSSRADPAVYSAERLQKRNPNIVPPGILRYGIEEVSPLKSAGVPAGVSRLADDVQGGPASRGFTLFKIPLALSHLVRHVGKTDDLELPGLRQCVEGGSLHFHCQDALCAAPCDHRFRLPKRRIGRPTSAHVQGQPSVVPSCANYLTQGRMQVAVR